MVTLLMTFFSVIIYETNTSVRLFRGEKRSLDDCAYFITLFFIIVIVTLAADRSPDYRAYMAFYKLCPSTIDFSSVYYSSDVHSEFGWKLLGNIFKAVGVPYEWFIAVVCGVSSVFLNIYIRKYVGINKTLSAFWIFGSFCLSYFYIGIRMGLSISIFLGILLPFLEEKKYIKYIIGVLICSTLHTVSIMYVLLIIVKKINLSHLKKYLVICVVIGLLFMVTGSREIMYRFIPVAFRNSLGYGREVVDQYPVLQLIYRLFFLAVSLYCYYLDGKNKPELDNFYKYYFVGMMFYLLFAGIPIIGTRVLDMVKTLEVIFVCKMIGENGQRRVAARLLFLASVLLCVFMVYYHIAAIKGYFPETRHYNILEFPFITIFSE